MCECCRSLTFAKLLPYAKGLRFVVANLLVDAFNRSKEEVTSMALKSLDATILLYAFVWFSVSGIKIVIFHVLYNLSFFPHSLIFFLLAKLSKNKEAAKTFTFLNF